MNNVAQKQRREPERNVQELQRRSIQHYDRAGQAEMRKRNVRQEQGRTAGQCARQERFPGSGRSKAKRRRRKRRKQCIHMIWQGSFLLMIVLLLLNIRMQLRKGELWETGNASGTQEEVNAKLQNSVPGVQKGNKVSLNYPDYCGLDEVDKPIKREPDEVLAKLQELSEGNDLIAEIVQNTQYYPDNMLEALANNPEMADFVSGYRGSDGSVSGGLTEREKNQKFPLFLQWDPRWGYKFYGDNSNIGLAGCGPVSLSMALYYLTQDETLTPDKIAAYSMENGYYMSGTGTTWALMNDVPAVYGVKVRQPGISEGIIKNELDQGNVIICAMRPGDFTAAGHFIVIYGYDENGFRVNDPNCVARSRQSWSFDKIKNQIKNLWSFS